MAAQPEQVRYLAITPMAAQPEEVRYLVITLYGRAARGGGRGPLSTYLLLFIFTTNHLLLTT